MDSEEDSSRAISHNLMADLLDIPHNFAPPPFELAPEGWEDSPTGPPLGTSSPPAPKKRKLSLSLSRKTRPALRAIGNCGTRFAAPDLHLQRRRLSIAKRRRALFRLIPSSANGPFELTVHGWLNAMKSPGKRFRATFWRATRYSSPN